MAGSNFGNIFKISTFGESHGKAIGVIVDGCPAGLSIDEGYIQKDLDRRKPGQGKYATKRSEDDKIEILSGVFEGKTIGSPIAMIIYNKDMKSKDYNDIKDIFRPGHGDYTYQLKYGQRDYRGGGRASARETAARVAAGSIARKILAEIDVEVFAYTSSVAHIESKNLDFSFRDKNELHMLDKDAYEQSRQFLDSLMKDEDSIGGSISCIIKNTPIGLGEPVFDKLDANLAKAILSINACKGFYIGNRNAHLLKGSENNDEFFMDNNKINKKSNNSGGVLAGISDGSDIYFDAFFKATPSISKEQSSVNKELKDVKIRIKGRHDPSVLSRAVVLVESMSSLVLVDMLLMNLSSNINNIKKIYKEDK